MVDGVFEDGFVNVSRPTVRFGTAVDLNSVQVQWTWRGQALFKRLSAAGGKNFRTGTARSGSGVAVYSLTGRIY